MPIVKILFGMAWCLLFHVTALEAHVAYDFIPSEYGLIQKRMMDDVTIQNEFRLIHDPVLSASMSTDATSDADQAASDLITGSQAEEDFELEEEFEEEFGEGSESKVFDPLVGYNRFMTKVNDKLYFWALKPVANGYRIVVPQGARMSINRFFSNLLFPVRFANNVLQLKFKRAGTELTRFGVNTTVGLLGFGDPAKKWFDLNAYPEDFGQTLGHYGVGSGFHIVLPVLGPSNLRDMIGLIPDYFLDPVSYYVNPWEVRLAVRSYNKVNHTSLHIGEYESFKKDAVDFYALIRYTYEQSRKEKIEE